MNEVQENVILRLYAEAVEYSPYPDNRDDKIVELWNYFSEDIPDWQDRFRRILEERRFLTAIKALDNLLANEKFIQKPSPSQTQRVIRMSWAPYYRPIADVEEDVRILEHSRFNYYMTMTYMDMMYRRGLIDKDEYELCHDKIGEKYGFKRDGVIWWSGPPTDGKTVEYPPKQQRKNRTYTKRNKEYWSKFEKGGSEEK